MKKADIVIITALEEERDAVKRHLDYLDKPKSEQVENRTVYRYNLHYKKSDIFYKVVLLCIGNMGNVEAGIDTTLVILDLNPSIIILTGIMGGVEEPNKLYLGDLIIPDQIINYEQAKITDTHVKRKYKPMLPDYKLLEMVKNFPFPKNTKPLPCRPDGKNRFPNTHTGTILSGEKIIADNTTIPNLQKSWPKLIGVEMESYGVSLAIYKVAESRPRFIMAKSICDWANSDKNDEWHEYAANIAAVFVIELLKSKIFFDRCYKNILEHRDDYHEDEEDLKEEIQNKEKILLDLCSGLQHENEKFRKLVDDLSSELSEIELKKLNKSFKDYIDLARNLCADLDEAEQWDANRENNLEFLKNKFG